MNYEQTKEKYEELKKLLQLYEILHDVCRIPYKDVHFYETPYFSSGYSMGETIFIFCNDVKIDEDNLERQYAKSCKWTPKHGRVIIRFTKKSLHEYINLRKSLDATKNVDRKNNIEMKKRLEIIGKIRNLVEKSVDKENSIIKKK